jgi:hypothetical protein
MKQVKILKSIAYAMLSVGIILVIIGVYKYTEKDKFLAQCKILKCKVIKVEEPSRGEVIFTFRDLAGTYPAFTYEDTYDTDGGKPEFKEGDITDVYYYAKDTKLSEPKDFFINYITPFILIVIGFAFFIDFPMMMFVVSLQKKKMQKNQTTTYGIKDSVISE